MKQAKAKRHRGPTLSDELKGEIMKLRDVAAYLHCHSTTINRLIAAHKIPGFRIGTDWRFRRADIDRWIAEAEDAMQQVPRRRRERRMGVLVRRRLK